MPVDMHPEEKHSGRRADPHAPARGRQVHEQELPVLGRPARRRRVGRQRALEARSRSAIRRDGQVYRMSFTNGDRRSNLERRRQGRQEQHRHDAALLARSEVFRHAEVLAAEAEARAARESGALRRPRRCARSTRPTGEKSEWHYEDGLRDYLRSKLGGARLAAARSRSPAQLEREDASRRLGARLAARRRARRRRATST